MRTEECVRPSPKGASWAFRVASRPQAGGGHVARCLALADALLKLGDRAIFILDNMGGPWPRRIAEAGHGCAAASDAPAEPVQGCLIDGYDFDRATIDLWRGRSGVMVAIVDHQPQPDWADLVIAPGGLPPESAAPKAQLLAGLDYALIDPAFALAAPCAVRRDVERVLVSFGRRDSRNATGLVLDALALLPQVRDGRIATTVAMGADAPHRSDIEARTARLPNVSCAVDADMLQCYGAADLAIGGGGVGLLERMAQGLPSVSISLADNQRQQIALAGAKGGTLDAGLLDGLTAAGLAAIVAPLIGSFERRAEMSRQARHAVDGRGPGRCARAMWEAVHVH